MKQHETITRSFNHAVIPQRKTDGYLNATAACKACGKLFADYKRLDSTQKFLDVLSQDTEIPVMGNPVTENPVAGIPTTETEFPKKGLIEMTRGGIPSLQGTWVHPYIAINLAQWLNPKFAVLVSKWVFDWMTTGQTPKPAEQIESDRVSFTKDRYIRGLSQIIDEKDHMIALQAELIARLKTEITQLHSEPERRPRVTPEETEQILTMKSAGYSTREIADTVGRNIDTVRTVLYREKKRR
jgi:hypothetical protein